MFIFIFCSQVFLYDCLCNQRNVQSPASRVQRPESSIQRPESSVQSPASRVQRPESSVQLLRPEPGNSSISFSASLASETFYIYSLPPIVIFCIILDKDRANFVKLAPTLAIVYFLACHFNITLFYWVYYALFLLNTLSQLAKSPTAFEQLNIAQFPLGYKMIQRQCLDIITKHS